MRKTSARQCWPWRSVFFFRTEVLISWTGIFFLTMSWDDYDILWHDMPHMTCLYMSIMTCHVCCSIWLPCSSHFISKVQELVPILSIGLNEVVRQAVKRTCEILWKKRVVTEMRQVGSVLDQGLKLLSCQTDEKCWIVPRVRAAAHSE